LRRRKKGFGVPLKHWFRDDWKGYAGDLLSSRRAAERGLFDAGEVKALLEGPLDGGRMDTQTIYALVVFEEWCRQYLDTPVPA
jgi:asparagine synthase (glutamine-hydrolysing)